MGRAWMTKSKLQTACDAGALAARRAMATQAWGAAVLSTADQYFATNFTGNQYGAIDVVHSFTQVNEEEVRGTASANVKTTLMKVFSFDTVAVEVSCNAVMNLPNSDIMFVLDTTGSMAETNPGDAMNRIDALRASVRDFHATIEASKSPSTQVRYGFVPYSNSVNVGFLLRPEWMVDRWTYQSREPDGTSVTPGGTEYMRTDESDWTQTSGPSTRTSSTESLPLEACVRPADAMNWGPTTVISTTTEPWAGPPAGTLTTEIRKYTADGTRYFLNQTTTSCSLTTEVFNGFEEQYTAKTYPDYSAASTTYWWQYRPVEYDLMPLKGMTPGLSIKVPIGSQHSMRDVWWNGCIEERDTVRADDYSTIPAGALDMDIDRIPVAGNPATQWRPAMSQLVFARDSFNNNWETDAKRYQWDLWNVGDKDGGAWATCPSPSRRLAAMSADDVNTYLDTLIPVGGTYHDIGLVWGARLLSGTGLFAAENSTAPNNGTIMRHLIFMTDGETDTDPRVYDAYGWPALDRRRVMDASSAPTKGDQDDLVEERTEALCAAVRGRNITVWVIAFGTNLTADLEACATSPAHAFEANGAVSLNNAFSEIAGSIANLRLNQ
jgi:Flp pilus assembly protein TadG